MMGAEQNGGCRGHRGTLDGIVDGQERLEALQALELHVTGCERCAARLAEARAVREALDSLEVAAFDRDSDDDFVDAVLARLDDPMRVIEPTVESTVEYGVVPGPSRRVPIRPGTPIIHRSWAPRIAAAAAVALVVGAGARALGLLGGGGDAVPGAVSGVAVAWDGGESKLAEAAGPGATERVELASEDPGQGNAGPASPGVASPRPEERVAEPELGWSLPPRSTEAEVSIDLGAFTAALEDVAEEQGFDPTLPPGGAAFASAIRARFGARSHEAARQLLRSGAETVLAARSLGPRADFGDRELLAESLGEGGPAFAWALADRGGKGVERLWRLAADDGGAAAQPAIRALSYLAAEGLSPSRWAPRATSPRTLGEVLVADLEFGAGEMLERFLGSGDEAWLAPWESHSGCAASVAERLDERDLRTLSAPERARMYRAASLVADERTWPLVASGLGRGDLDALDVLVAIPERVRLMGLLDLTVDRSLEPETEEVAWAAVLEADAMSVADLLDEATLAEPAGTVEALLDALLRSQMHGAVELPLACAISRAAARTDLGAHLRVAALDAVGVRVLMGPGAVAGGPTVPETPSARPQPLHDAAGDLHSVLIRLASDDDRQVAASAWIALAATGASLETESSALRRAVERPGEAGVRRARVARALQRHRSAAERAEWTRTQP